jgi:hypothetical protein
VLRNLIFLTLSAFERQPVIVVMSNIHLSNYRALHRLHVAFLSIFVYDNLAHNQQIKSNKILISS